MCTALGEISALKSILVCELKTICKYVEQSVLHNRCSYQFNEALGLLGDPARVVRRVRPDGVKQLVLVVALERGLTNQHLVHQHAERPPVD